MNNIVKIILILSLLVSNNLIGGKNNISGNAVAAVDGEMILASDFIDAYSDILIKYGLSDSKKLRRETLDDIIRDKILYLYALEEGLNLTDRAQRELDRIKIQTLLNSFVTTQLAPQISVSEYEILEYYRRMNTKLKLRQIYSDTEAGIDSLYSLLEGGADFAELASRSFSNRYLAANSGLLGYVGFDELHPAVEEASYSLAVDQYSLPVKTGSGYCIVRLEDIKPSAILTQNDFNNKRDAVKTLALKKKQELFFQSYIREIVEGNDLVINRKALDGLWDHYKSFTNLKLETSNAPGGPDQREVILTGKQLEWTIKDFYHNSIYTSEDQKRMVRSKENLEEFIKGLAARDIIMHKAKSLGLQSSDSYSETVIKKFENFLVNEAEDLIRLSLDVTREKAYQFYNKNIHLYTIPGKIKLSAILLDNKQVHDHVIHELNDGKEFSELAEEYSIQRQTAVKGGELGYFTRDELGWTGNDMFALSPGEYKGNFMMDGKYLIALCTDKTTVSVAAFEEVEESIVEELRSFAVKRELEKFTSARKHQWPVSINKELLESLTISMNQ